MSNFIMLTLSSWDHGQGPSVALCGNFGNVLQLFLVAQDSQ